jgi:hypothetical protein
MSARRTDGINGFRAELIGELTQIGGGELAQISGNIDPVEKRGRAPL